MSYLDLDYSDNKNHSNFITRNSNNLGIYIHFPFCIQKCYYCDFYSLSLKEENLNLIDIEKMFVKRIKEEFEFRYEHFKNFKIVNTIYFGGGTSSLLSAESLKEMLDFIKSYFELSDYCEITLEGNPEHLYSLEYLQSIKEIGINRVNIGFQTNNKKFLDLMNRFYDPSHYEEVILNVSKIFHNFGVDLIYGYPEQTIEDFYKDLDYVLSFPVKHLSIYSLTREKGTMYDKLIKQKLLPPPEEKLQEQIFSNLNDILKQYSFYPYEVSNYSKIQYECRHNLRYWLYEAYMGLGPSSHGFNGYYRYNNYKNWEKWLKYYNQNYTIHDSLKEIAITMFRLQIPINLQWIMEITPDYEIFYKFFENMKQRKYGDIIQHENTHYFIWYFNGISILDHLILEFFDFIEESNLIKY